jgi:hypothetical protein
MSDIEYVCRLEIAHAYALWRYRHGIGPIQLIAYMRALGLDAP